MKVNIGNEPGSVNMYHLVELAGLLHVSHRTVQRYLKAGRIRAVKIGGKWMVSDENLRAFLNGNEINPT